MAHFSRKKEESERGERETAVAIVGMSCRFAGCPSPQALWNAVMTRRSLLTPPGPDAELPFGHQALFARPYPAVLGQLGDLYSCLETYVPRSVAGAGGLHLAELNAGVNQDLYFTLQLAMDALADAGLHVQQSSPFRGSLRVAYSPPFNSSTMHWLQRTMFLDQAMDILRRFFPNAAAGQYEDVRRKLLDSLPETDADSLLMGSGFRFASWIARRCAFSGVASVTDAGMLSGAVTLMEAMDDLRTGRSDVALAGALMPPYSRAFLEGLAGMVPFSTRAELQPFAREQFGTVPGEGGAFFVLKRRSDALREHDRIYAVIRSVAVGRNPEDDPSAVLAAALDRAGVEARTVGLVEADGSGVPEAEAREVAAIARLWGEHRPGGALVGVGSVKGNIGHTLNAALAAGVVKAALALHRRVLPPQVPTENPREELSCRDSSAYLLTEARPWLVGDSSTPRRAAVIGSNFDSISCEVCGGVSGRAAAIVLEEEGEDRA